MRYLRRIVLLGIMAAIVSGCRYDPEELPRATLVATVKEGSAGNFEDQLRKIATRDRFRFESAHPPQVGFTAISLSRKDMYIMGANPFDVATFKISFYKTRSGAAATDAEIMAMVREVEIALGQLKGVRVEREGTPENGLSGE